MRTVRRIRSIAPERAWELVGRGEARLLDLRTELERRRYGWPPGAPRVSLTRHVARPGGPDTIYLCQHANRSKFTARRGAAEVAGGWPAWQAAGMPIERPAVQLTRPLPQDEFERIFSRVPRLTVELVIASTARGALLAPRDFGPCKGLWHLPGGTVRFGEPLVEAVKRVAQDELGIAVSVGQLLGYIEYPSHYNNGLDSPVGLAFRAHSPIDDLPDEHDLGFKCAWFTVLPDNMHDEQKKLGAAPLEGLADARREGRTRPANGAVLGSGPVAMSPRVRRLQRILRGLSTAPPSSSFPRQPYVGRKPRRHGAPYSRITSNYGHSDVPPEEPHPKKFLVRHLDIISRCRREPCP